MTDQSPGTRAASAEERFRRWAEADFTDSGSGSPPAPEVRIANAMEFLAFRMGRIDQKLGRLVELLEKQQSGA